MNLLPVALSKSQYDSVSSLAELALRSSGADGYALYARDHCTGVLTARLSAGRNLPQPEDLSVRRGVVEREGGAIASYPLRVENSVTGILAFSFRPLTLTDEKSAVLDRMANTIEKVYCFPNAIAQVLARINRLETDLITAKISARALGLLDASSHDNAGEAIVRHTENVLRSSRLLSVLDRLIRESEEEIDERRLAAQAKVLLQKRHGISEEQAHVFLRVTSRRSRRRISEIARDLIAQGGDAGAPRSMAS